jgi:hypothetical protein
MNNIQLEIALKEAQKGITELRTEIENLKSASAQAVSVELASLREVLDKTFNSIGFGTDWCRAQVQCRVPSPAIAAQMYEVPETPKSLNDNILAFCNEVLAKK